MEKTTNLSRCYLKMALTFENLTVDVSDMNDYKLNKILRNF